MSELKPDDSLHPMPTKPSENGEIMMDNVVTHDAVFGDITEEGPNFRNVGWLGTTVLMLKAQIGLGVLTVPFTFHSLGIVPGVIILCLVGAITTWSGYVVGMFKLNHPNVYGLDDAGHLMFGPIGREVLSTAFTLFFILSSGSAMISLSVAFNALSGHGACTAVFVAVAAIIGFLFASVRTLGNVSWLAWIGVTSIVAAVLTVTISVGIQDRPASAPQDVPWQPDYKVVGNPSFTDAVSAVSSIVFAYAGTAAFFPIVSEMRQPRHYTRALISCQSLLSAIYVAVGVVVYYYCGSYVSSPAPGSAGPLVKKVSYGLALPGLSVSVMLPIHLSSKHVFVRILRGSRHLTANTMIHWCTWLGCTFGVTMVAYLIASGVPIFSGLTSLSGALLGTFMSFLPMGCMWLYENWNHGKASPTWKWCCIVAWSVFVLLSGAFLVVAGTYSSIVGIIKSYKESGGSPAWGCADNSGTV